MVFKKLVFIFIYFFCYSAIFSQNVEITNSSDTSIISYEVIGIGENLYVDTLYFIKYPHFITKNWLVYSDNQLNEYVLLQSIISDDTCIMQQYYASGGIHSKLIVSIKDVNLIRRTVWYENGQMKYDDDFEEIDKTVIYYYENGNIRWRYKLKNLMPSDKYEEFYKKGNVKISGQYNTNHNKTGKWLFYKKTGIRDKYILYNNGEVMKICKFVFGLIPIRCDKNTI